MISDSKDSNSPTCAKCFDRGFYLLAVRATDPRFGQLYPCECKQGRDRIAAEENRKAKLRSQRGRFADASLDNFDWDRPLPKPATWEQTGKTASPAAQRKFLYEARDRLRAYCDNPVGGLYLQGNYGSGKTHLGAALANHWSATGRRSEWLLLADFIDYLAQGFGDHTTGHRMREIAELDLLVIDDFGSEHLATKEDGTLSWPAAQVLQLINDRYNHEKPTVVTSNIPINRIGGRVGSRLLQLCDVVPVIAYDYREYLAEQRRAGASNG